MSENIMSENVEKVRIAYEAMRATQEVANATFASFLDGDVPAAEYAAAKAAMRAAEHAYGDAFAAAIAAGLAPAEAQELKKWL